MDTNSLNLFFGQPSSEDFLEDLEILKKFQEKEVIELIDWIIKYYPTRNIDDEWEKLAKNFTDEEKKEKKSVIRIFISVFKEFVSDNVSESELKSDFDDNALFQGYIDYFTNKLKPVKDEFRKKALRNEKPYENILVNIDWRIDKKTYRDGEEKNVAVVELIHFLNGERQATQIELNIKALKHLIYRLKKIEEEL